MKKFESERNANLISIVITIYVHGISMLLLVRVHQETRYLLCVYICMIVSSGLSGYANQVGAEPDRILSLTALQSLNALESLNLEETQVRDATLYPLSGYQTLSHLSLKSDSLTDMSLHHLSSLLKLKDLALRDAVLTDGGLESFLPPIMLRVLDLRGCWLLTKGAILSFCKYHPQVEVKHELVHIIPSDQTVFTSRTSQGKQKQGQMPMSQSKLMGDIFLGMFFSAIFYISINVHFS